MLYEVITIKEMVGVGYNPLSDRWALGRDLDVNYMVFATKS